VEGNTIYGNNGIGMGGSGGSSGAAGDFGLNSGFESPFIPPVDTTIDPNTGMNSNEYYDYYNTFS
jgi:hypothetical protein